MTQNVKITEVICSVHHKIKRIEWMSHEMNRIQSNYHVIGIYKKNKVSLSYYNEKNIHLRMILYVVAFW